MKILICFDSSLVCPIAAELMVMTTSAGARLSSVLQASLAQRFSAFLSTARFTFAKQTAKRGLADEFQRTVNIEDLKNPSDFLKIAEISADDLILSRSVNV